MKPTQHKATRAELRALAVKYGAHSDTPAPATRRAPRAPEDRYQVGELGEITPRDFRAAAEVDAAALRDFYPEASE